jgi:RimJ/RimL family protein N-acetyltransferase
MDLAAATLANKFVRLEPFEARHRDGLIEAAHADMSIFRHMPYPVAREGYGGWFDWLMQEQAAGRWIAHAVIATLPPLAGEVDRAQRETLGALVTPPSDRFAITSPVNGGENIVGQSCYLNIRPHDAGVEIGGTWYRREAQGTAINPAAKLLLIEHAFACGAERVEFKTDALNAQSRAALTKLGATFEGVFRRQMRRPDGSMRDNAYFSVIREEWPALKARIGARLEA